ncbi:UDP-N-acetylglucosamine--N-acetylmuramyl-(pentapeptide) pyrophosphoryl-undecaprenol N-acetylglucosamine transferase, partial [Parabacteroides sp. OttesenSCG-928-G07]|nr:UDP-N-acetylglucosamine--N-acetylmuramyl-(pentapeptide) pyrophosphoryl-undecaprenol N-acetylglucosamine transferase [Parabacteroides sp. OttesenSCG-928-G07]
SGFDRKNIFNNIKVVARLIKSLRKAKKVIRDFQPDIAIGVGGYASGPTLWMAASQGIPTLLQEQNSYAGVTNKLLAKKAHKICVAYDGMEHFFPKEKIVLTGNPIRKDLQDALNNRDEALSYFGLTPERKTVLVVGGSLGARTINRSIKQGLSKLTNAGIQVIWQTGKFYYAEASEKVSQYESKDVWCSDFITRMDYAYAAADLVVSRAGAGSISELCLLKKPVILVPSPNVAEDHQTKNALALVDKQAAILIKDTEAESKLIDTILETIQNDQELSSLSSHIESLAQYDSAERIVDEIVRIIEK